MNYKKSFALWVGASVFLLTNIGITHAGTGTARLFVSANVMRSCSIAFDQKAVGVDCGSRKFATGAGSTNLLRPIDLLEVAHSIEHFDQLDGVAQIMVTF